MTLGFPPFYGAVKQLVIANTVVFLAMLLLGGIAPAAARWIFGVFALTPYAVTHGLVWQVASYSFLHAGLFHILFNMITLWMFGAGLEQGGWDTRQFYEFYFFCVIGAALTTMAVSYAGLIPALGFLGVSPMLPTVGASGGIFGVMVAFAMLYGNQEFMMFPLPIMIKAKYLVAIFILIALAEALGGGRGQSVAYFAHLGGALFGWFYIRFLPKRGLAFATSEQYFGVRNSYYRWKRRRAARKFEVYMRKHDRSEYFDEHGNYRPKERNDEGDGPKWVN